MPTKQPFIYPDATELTVVIRAAGERTEEACIASFARQLPLQSQLVVIHESPFSKAVTRSFEIGIQSNRPWLIAVDADILPLDDVVTRIREICSKMASNAFVATPLFLCQTMGGLATRGLHCYRTSMLQEAIELAPTLPDDLRPESRFHDAMVERGYTRECYAKILGLHEFEQSAIHLYLKGMLRSRKEPESDRTRAYLAERAKTSRDCQIVLWGFDDALIDPNPPIEYDWNTRYPKFEQRMHDADFEEKPTLGEDLPDGFVKERINAHDYRADTRTLGWIRDILHFADGAPDALAYVNATPLLSTNVPSPIG